MMNINCSENCIHCYDGNCTFNYVSNISNSVSKEHKCAYFEKKDLPKKASQKT
ncbi:hypothetical protein GCM10008905_03960 [Clostridium malenominatum]|uniref:Hydroxymyristoyl-ACP dehydratase n=1 Tax=Clostridium malenominatum TaxID=1539 RepID=A0ABN1IN76_9CLOT